MKVRNTSYSDYGFDDKNEVNRLIDFCKGPDFEYRRELIESAECANKLIAGDLFYSLTEDLSYDDISKIKYIPYSKTDFYAYRRKCLQQFREFLILYGKWGRE